ncbi:MAG: chromosome replication initiation : rane attachment protein [Bacillota bacterium]|jgi:replication initiation and membrane attachment protein
MKIITSQDFIQIRSESMISSLDLDFLFEAYAPFIGVEAVGLYGVLKQQDQLLEGNQIIFSNFLSLFQSSPQTFHSARMQLEAVGLLRTYHQFFEKTNLFTFSLYAPKSPKAFMEDPILKGLLIQRTNTLYLKKIESKYMTPPLDSQSKDVSVSFAEVFHPDLNHPAFLNQVNSNVKGKSLAEIRQPFDQLKFAEQLQHQFSIDINKLHADDLQQVISIATLTGLDELATADIVGTNLDLNHRLKMDKIMQAARQEKRLPSFIRQRQQQKVQLQGTSSQAQLMNQMEMMSPLDFLMMKQQGAEVSPADFSLLLRLKTQYALPASVINALIHHVLTTQNNVLSSRYVEKLAGSLTRANVQHAIDTMDYFYQLSQPRQSKLTSKKETQESNSPSLKKDTYQPVNDVDEGELDQLENKMKGLK